MKKNLFICETPFQVLASLFLIYESFNNDMNDFIIVDTMKYNKSIAEKMKGVFVVDYAFAASTEELRKKNTLSGVIRSGFPVFSKLCAYEKIGERYDRFFCRNYTTPLTEAAFVHFNKLNSDMKIHIFDEGYSSYLSSFWCSHKSISTFHKISNMILSGKKDYLYRNIEETLFFAPELLHIKLPFPVRRMIKEDFAINKKQLRSINYVFGYDSSKNDGENQFIFFEECFSFDDGNNSDLEIVEWISSIVGKEKLKIKLHPRSKTDRFSRLGYDVMTTAQYPWEVYALNNANKRITLIAYSSGALINYLFFSRSKMKSVFLYNVFPDKYNHMAEKELQLWFKEFQSMYSSWVYVPESKSRLEEILKSEISNAE